MKQHFNQILDDLGKELKISLFQDKHGVCELATQHKLRIQLFYDSSRDLLTIGSFLCELPPGVYQERLLQALLKVNGNPAKVATFAYSARNNQVTLFTYVHPPFISGELIAKTLESFLEKALEWKEVIEKGKPFPEGEETLSGPPPPFRSF